MFVSKVRSAKIKTKLNSPIWIAQTADEDSDAASLASITSVAIQGTIENGRLYAAFGQQGELVPGIVRWSPPIPTYPLGSWVRYPGARG